jgi:hypothetical protein
VASLEKFGEFRSFGGKIRFGRLHGFGAGGQIGLAGRVLRFAFRDIVSASLQLVEAGAVPGLVARAISAW